MQQTSELELLAEEYQHGRAEFPQLIESFLGTTLAMPSVADPTGESGVQPVFHDDNGVAHIVVATSETGLNRTNEIAGFAFTVLGSDVVRGLAPGMGVLVNTAQGGFTLPADLVDSLRGLLAEQAQRARQSGTEQ